MSGVTGSSGESPVFRAKTSRFDVSYAVKGQRRELDPEEAKQIQQAIETIRWIGENDSNAAASFKVFEQEGKQLRIGKDRIEIKKGQKWVNLLSDKSISGKTRRSIRSVTSAMTKALGGTKDAIVNVSISSIPDRFNHRYEEEYAFFQEVENLHRMIQDESWQGYLQYSGMRREEIELIQEDLKNLEDAVGKFTAAMEQINSRMIDGDVQRAVEDFNAFMPELFKNYTAALQKWDVDQWAINITVQEDPENPFQLDTARSAVHLATFSNLIEYAEEKIPGVVDVAQAFKEIETSHQRYQNFIRLSRLSHQAIYDFHKEEKGFQTQLVRALMSLEDPSLKSWLKEHGFTSQEIDAYRAKLNVLADALDQILLILETSKAYLNSGMIKDGMDHYAKEMATHASVYQQALSDLIVAQRVGQGRLPDSILLFSLNLDRLKMHETFLQEISALSQANPTIGVSETSWQPALTELSKSSGALSSQITLDKPTRILIAEFNDLQNTFRTLSIGMRTFAEHFNTNRELFEQLMRDQGFSDIETAFMFNHYEKVSEALGNWVASSQRAIDLANQEKLPEAIEAFASLIKARLSGLFEDIRHAFIAADMLQDSKVGEVFNTFLTMGGITEPAMRNTILHALISPKYATHIGLYFNEMVRMFFELKHPDENWSEKKINQLPSVISEASTLLKQQLQELNNFKKEIPEFYSQKRLLDHFFFLSSNPEWNGMVKANGWTEKEIKKFDLLFNKLSEEVEGLRIAEMAYENETNSVKKRALKTQFKQRVQRATSRIKLLERNLAQLGGLKRVERIYDLIDQYAEKTPASMAFEMLDKLYRNKAKEFQALGLNSTEEMIENLKAKIQSSPVIEGPRLLAQFSTELDVISQYNFINQTKRNLADVIKLVGQQTQYINRLNVDLGLSISWEYGVVEKMLLAGPHKNEPIWRQVLTNHGWSIGKVEAFSENYDAFVHSYERIYLAKKALDEDPENVLLQRALINTQKEEIPKFQRALKQLRKAESLQTAITEFEQRLLKSSDLYDGQDQTLRMLMQLGRLTDDIREKSAWVDEAINLPPLSWGNNYMKVLVDPHSKIFSLTVQFGREKVGKWEQLLKNYDLKKTDLNEIQKLMRDYNLSLKKIQEGERQLETNPGDEKLRVELKKLLSEERGKLQKLNHDFDRLQSEISSLHLAQKEFESYVRTNFENLRETQIQINELGRDTAEGKYLLNQLKLDRAKLDGLKNSEIEDLLYQLETVDVLGVLNSRRGFMFDTYQRFAIL